MKTAILLCALLCSCSSIQSNIKTVPPKEKIVRLTSYSHLESDSLKYGRKNAVGTNLCYYGEIRSSAADWSVYPLGTQFKIKGINSLFTVDDYGSSLIGTKTIDIYFPTKSLMRKWDTQ